MKNIIHTKWKIEEEPFYRYVEHKNREVSVWRYVGSEMLDRRKLVEYAKTQLGKRYDVITLFVQALYILSGKRLWIGYKNKEAEKNHVCSEFVAWAYYYVLTNKPPFYRPWLVTANDIADSPEFRQIKEKDSKPGDIVLVHTKKSPLAWIIRRFTKSHWNHAALLV